MTTEEELKAYKLQMVRRNRLTSFVLGSAAVVSVLFMIYGFTQSIEVDKQRFSAIESEKNATIYKEQLEKCESSKK